VNGGPEEAARQGLTLLSTVSRVLDGAGDDLEGALEEVATACVPAFADGCAIVLIAPDQEAGTSVVRAAVGSGLEVPVRWFDVIRDLGGADQPVLVLGGAGERPQVAAVRERLRAGSLLVAPIASGPATLGWLVAATGEGRRNFVEPELQVGAEVAHLLGATMRRLFLERQLQAAAHEQGRVAHDFNNLLTLILGYSELLGRAISDPQLRPLAVEIEGAARRAASLTHEMVDPSGGEGIGPAPGHGSAGDRPPGHPTSAPSPGTGDRGSPASDRRDVPAGDGQEWPAGRTMVGRVLYVEDEPALRQAGRESLATVGLQVVAVDSAEKALSILDDDPAFDALVTDIALPGLTGLQLVRAVRPAHPDLKVLYVTGYSGVADPDHTPAPGEPVLRKPFQPDVLRLRVAELLQPGDDSGGGVSEPVHGS
jgi:CheY-like chemotaxis protein